MLAVVAEGHSLLAAQPGHKILVGPHQAVGLHREDAGAQVVDDLVGAVGLGGDVGVEADERLTHPRLDHHVTELARDGGVGGIGPARRAQLIAKRLTPVGRCILTHHGRWRAAELCDGIEDHLLDGVGFGEHTTSLHKRAAVLMMCFGGRTMPSALRAAAGAFPAWCLLGLEKRGASVVAAVAARGHPGLDAGAAAGDRRGTRHNSVAVWSG